MISDIIKSLDFFSSLTDEQVDMVASISVLKSYNQDSIIHYEKTNINLLEFLTDGLAKAYKIDKHENEIFLYYIYKNMMLSQISSLDAKELYPYSNTVALEDSKILAIDYSKFKTAFLDKNILTLELAYEVIKQSSQLHKLINREFIYDSVAKVAMMIGNDLTMFNRLKRHDISLVLHIQPATLSRVLNRLKRDKIIDIIQGNVEVLDFEGLRKIYEEQQS